MQKFVSREKLGKRAKRALDKEQRKTWIINPISRKSNNMKAYDRKKARHQADDDGIGLYFVPLLFVRRRQRSHKGIKPSMFVTFP